MESLNTEVRALLHVIFWQLDFAPPPPAELDVLGSKVKKR